jgi:hypothetical protein
MTFFVVVVSVPLDFTFNRVQTLVQETSFVQPRKFAQLSDELIVIEVVVDWNIDHSGGCVSDH